MDRFVFLTVDGLATGRGVRRLRAGAGARSGGRRGSSTSPRGRWRWRPRTSPSASAPATGSYWLGFVAALVGGLLLGALVERARDAFRRSRLAAQRGDRRARAGAGVQAVLGMVYGNEFLPADGPVQPHRADDVGGVAAAVAVRPVRLRRGARWWSAAWRCCSPRTSVGLRMRAAAFAPEVSRLLGVNVGGMLTLGWALAAAVGRAGRACWSCRPSSACTRTRWTWCSSPRSPRRSSAGWTARRARWSAGWRWG